MKLKHQRMVFIVAGAVCLVLAAVIIATVFKDNLVYFYSPTDIQQKSLSPGKTIRAGGLVKEGSLQQSGSESHFMLTDLTHDLPVRYTGILPPIFREGQGVVAEGMLNEDGSLTAKIVLTKHDENYMPPEVADALKKSGKWKGGKE